MSVPLETLTLIDHRDLVAKLTDLGYDGVWSSESVAADAFTPLTLATAWAPELTLGTAIVPVQTRGPAVLAQSFASLAEAAPGRVRVGIGASTHAIVTRLNAADFARPYQRTEDTLRFLKAAFRGERITHDYQTFSVSGFTLTRPLSDPPPILLAAGREKMLRLAGREADGALVNWVSAADIPMLAKIVNDAADGAHRDIVTRVFVCPSTDAEMVRARFRPIAATYLAAYRAVQEFTGRADRLREFFTAWDARDRRAAEQAIPNDVMDEVIVHGAASACREAIDRYFDNGLTDAIVTVLPYDMDEQQAIRDLAPVHAR